MTHYRSYDLPNVFGPIVNNLPTYLVRLLQQYGAAEIAVHEQGELAGSRNFELDRGRIAIVRSDCGEEGHFWLEVSGPVGREAVAFCNSLEAMLLEQLPEQPKLIMEEAA